VLERVKGIEPSLRLIGKCKVEAMDFVARQQKCAHAENVAGIRIKLFGIGADELPVGQFAFGCDAFGQSLPAFANPRCKDRELACGSNLRHSAKVTIRRVMAGDIIFLEIIDSNSFLFG
jgi:hypothetical protein